MAPPRVKQRVPSTAPAVAAWAATWAKLCADGDKALGPLSDEYSRANFQLTGRQLRNIRNAAISGALRRRAKELRVALPTGYVDRP